MANRLAGESSPYLLQHAHNPVDWYPWGDEAFARARAENKPILLSVGYSACHWCHVMERESFENSEIAALMNSLFVNVKVDREERPDVDQIYMQAVQAMTGHGGWPMTVFLTPEGVPFYGGTYFPPEDRHGMPAFPRVLQGVATAYRDRRGEVVESGRQLLEQMRQGEHLRASATVLTDEVLLAAFQGVSGQFDERDGGTAGAPKFPQPMIWESVLRFWRRTGNPRALDMVEHTLTRMARGGMYDQIGGGFHRYSVDAHWLVPHFEKMLYDNAQLAQLYLHAWLATGNPEFRRVTGDPGLSPARDAPPRRRLLLGPGRGLGRCGGQVLRLDAGRAAGGPWRRRRDARGPRVLGHGRRPQLRGREHPARAPAAQGGRRAPRAHRGGAGRAHRARPPRALPRPRAARASGARRQGAGRLEWARPGRLRRGRPLARTR
jgi:hypothetical protein